MTTALLALVKFDQLLIDNHVLKNFGDFVRIDNGNDILVECQGLCIYIKSHVIELSHESVQTVLKLKESA